MPTNEKKLAQSPFAAAIDHMIDITGVPCVAMLNGKSTDFRGIFDEVARTEIDGGFEVLTNATTITVKRSIANALLTNQDLTVEVQLGETPVRYRVRDKQPVEDGALVQIFIGLRTDVAQPNPYEEAEDEFEGYELS